MERLLDLVDLCFIGNSDKHDGQAALQLYDTVRRRDVRSVIEILTGWVNTPAKLDGVGYLCSELITPGLIVAIRTGQADLVDILLKVSTLREHLPIREAINAGEPQTLEVLCCHGWDINKPIEHNGPAPLGYAVRNEHLVGWFLARNADPNAGFAYDTPMSRAAIVGSRNIIDLLLGHGGNLEKGQVLHWAIERENEAASTIRYLLGRGAPCNRLEFDGKFPIWSPLGPRGLGTPLHKAVRNGKLDVLLVLLQHGACVEIRDSNGKTPLELARYLHEDGAVAVLQNYTALELDTQDIQTLGQ